MRHFFDSNPGLRSRFNTFIEFPDYSAEELIEMFMKLCQENDYVLTEDAQDCISTIMSQQVAGKKEHFANGRLVRNIYDLAALNLARRASKLENPSVDDLSRIMCSDLMDIVTDDTNDVAS